MNIPLYEWSGSGATKALHLAMDKYAAEGKRQANHLLALTWANVALTVTLLIAVGAQIYLAVPLTP